jgi:dolichol-phosphate mannosyltransferase
LGASALIIPQKTSPFDLAPPQNEINSNMLSLVLPTFNEYENISQVIPRLEKALGGATFEIIVVDDNSPDGTAQVAQALNRKYGNIKVCERSGKLGLSSAVLYGFRNANGNVFAVMDADMQHPPEILREMYLKIAHGFDLVIASRYVKGGGIRNWKVTRIIFSKGATLMAHMLLPNSRRVKDVMSGCFMVRKGNLENSSLNPIGFKILLEILSKCAFKNIIEVPYVFTNRRNGKSNLSSKEINHYIVHICRLFFYSASHTIHKSPMVT